MLRSARMAYESVAKVTDSSRELEATALFKASRKFEACIQAWDTPECNALLVEALRYNQRLWTLFQSELAQPANPLPGELKVNLLRLSAFIDKRTFEILAQPSPDKLKALIDINRNIAAGLAQHSPAGAVPPAEPGGEPGR
jgi:flagellar biosynthesis activator protein FlaF